VGDDCGLGVEKEGGRHRTGVGKWGGGEKSGKKSPFEKRAQGGKQGKQCLGKGTRSNEKGERTKPSDREKRGNVKVGWKKKT